MANDSPPPVEKTLVHSLGERERGRKKEEMAYWEEERWRRKERLLTIKLIIALLTEQCGHMKPLIFSIIPIIGKPIFLQKLTSLLTSARDTP